MNKSIFLERKKHILSEIESWKEELRDVEEEYISSNQKFPIGSKVCITTPAYTGRLLDTHDTKFFPERKRYAYIAGYKIFCNEVEPILMKEKKDGTISKVRDHLMFEKETIELV